MLPFDFYLPYSIEEALSLLSADDPDIRPVGGGTAVWLMMKAGVLSPSRLVSLQKIEPIYSEITSENGELVIGGLTRLSTIEHDVSVRRGWPLINRTLQTLANVRVRSVATIGGNISHADPHMDMPPVLAALRATVIIAGPGGVTRRVAADEFCTGYYETVLQRNELVASLCVPRQANAYSYMKVTTRAKHDWPALGLAVVFQLDNGTITQPSIVLGAATDRPTRLLGAEQLLNGNSIKDDRLLEAAAEAGAGEVELTADPHGSSTYKQHLLKTTLIRAVRQAALKAGNAK